MMKCLGWLVAALSVSISVARGAPDDTTVPVRPGEPGVRSFWNVNGQRFIYAPRV